MYTILVTGSSRGIGFAIVSALLNEFHDSVMVVGVARGKCSLEGHRNYRHVQGNVESPTTLNDVEELIRCLQEKKMPLVGVVYNAGVVEPLGPLASMEAGEVERWTRRLLPHILASSDIHSSALPKIIVMSSGAAVNPYAGMGAYNCSKAAITMWVKVMAKEVENVNWLAVRPGMVDSQMQTSIRSQPDKIPAAVFQKFLGAFEDRKLLMPNVPGGVVARLLMAGRSVNFVEEWDGAWNGSMMDWDDPSFTCYQSQNHLV